MTTKHCSEWKKFINEVKIDIEIKYENLTDLEVHKNLANMHNCDPSHRYRLSEPLYKEFKKDVEEEKYLLLTQLNAINSFCKDKEDETKISQEFETRINSRLNKFLNKTTKPCIHDGRQIYDF
jgi:hypothetical protein